MDMGQDRDEWFMAQVAAGHSEPLESLVRRHGTVVDYQRSEDRFQDVFLIVWTKRRQCPPLLSTVFIVTAFEAGTGTAFTG